MEQTLLYIITAASVITCICVIITMILVLTSYSDMKQKLDSVIQKCNQGTQNRSQSEILKGKTELLAEMKTAIAAAVAEQMKHEQKQILSAVQTSQTAQQTVQQEQVQSQQIHRPQKKEEVNESAQEMNIGTETKSEKTESGADLEQTLFMPKIEIEKRGSVLCRKCYKPYPSTERACPYCNTKQ